MDSKKLFIKVKTGGKAHSIEYANEVNIYDANLLLDILYDLQGCGLPLKKMIELYLQHQGKQFPIKF